jgi:hypothetical protein
MPVYFCEKASPWQRPSNENTNGLLRQYFPKGSDLRVHSAGELAGLAGLTRLPAGHWTGERAARDIVTLARKGRAFASLDALIARQGGQHVLYGSALVLAAALPAWARHAGTPLTELARTVLRLKPVRPQPSVASVARMAGIRRCHAGVSIHPPSTAGRNLEDIPGSDGLSGSER